MAPSPTVAELVAAGRKDVRERRLTLVRDWEVRRRGVQRALHDRAQQQLLGLRMALLRSTEQSDVDDLTSRVAEIGAELERLAHGLPPSSLRIDDMTGALREIASQSGIEVQLDLPERFATSVVVGELLTYTASEALANVLRHSAADRCTLSVHDRAGEVLLVVTDPGPPTSARADGAGHGLDGLRLRAGLLGGRLDVDFGSAATTLTLSVPDAVDQRRRRPTSDSRSTLDRYRADDDRDRRGGGAAEHVHQVVAQELRDVWNEQRQVERRASAIEASLARRLTSRPLRILTTASEKIANGHRSEAAALLLEATDVLREIVSVLADESSSVAEGAGDPFLFGVLGNEFGVAVRVRVDQLPPRAERESIAAMGERIIVDAATGSQLELHVHTDGRTAVLRALLDGLPSPRALAFIEDTVLWRSGELTCEPRRDRIRLEAVLPCAR